jgi:antitoxin ParD1/3/4
MNVSLPPELELFVTQKVESGLYQTPNEVIREGLRLLRERDDLRQQKVEEVRKDIAAGLEQAKQGQVGPLNASQTLARVRQNRLGSQAKS